MNHYQIWATIILYYLGSIADRTDRRNLRNLHFFNQQNFCYKSKSNVINLSKSFFPNFYETMDLKRKKKFDFVYLFMLSCVELWSVFSSECSILTSQHFISIWHFMKKKLVSSSQWTNFYFSMNLWQKLFATDSFLYKLIKKYYGWTT